MKRHIGFVGLAIATWVCIVMLPGHRMVGSSLNIGVFPYGSAIAAQSIDPAHSIDLLNQSIHAEFIASTVIAQDSAPTTESSQAFLTQAYELYQDGRLQAARDVLEQALEQYRTSGDRLFEAAALSNLSLVHQALGDWPSAESTIQRSLERLGPHSSTAQLPIRAQALEVYGTLQLVQGQAADALETWDEAFHLFRQSDDALGQIRNGLNQVTALQVLGLYRQAVEIQERLLPVLDNQPDSRVHVVALQNLGNSLRRVGNLQDSQQILQQGLEMAIRLSDEEAIASSQIALANTVYTLGERNQALTLYQLASSHGSSITQIYGALNHLRLLIEQNRRTEARAMIPAIEQKLVRLPSSRTAAIAQINLGRSVAELEQGQRAQLSSEHVAHYFVDAYQQAESLGDRRVKSLALGYLGELYEQTTQWEDAQGLVEQALDLSEGVYASDLSYRWQWQLGRIYNAQGDREAAIATYDGALRNLEKIRADLIATSTDFQFSFREEIEPIYRELVSLLLSPDVTPSVDELEKARKTIESLQLAELDNFFRAACLNGREVEIDDVDRRAAVLYPIVLPDRLEVVVSIPDGDAWGDDVSEATILHDNLSSPQSKLLRHTTMLTGGQGTIEQTARELLLSLKKPMFSRQSFVPAQQLYDWMIRPFDEALEAAQITQLVFVLDDVLRNVPMAVLHDGDHYLVERYSLAITPGLQLLASQPVRNRGTSVLLAGISEPRQGFSALPGVLEEIQSIQDSLANTQMLVNQDVTSTTLQTVLSTIPSRVVHLATHGQFSSKLEDTFVLTWDGRIQIDQLSALLEQRELSTNEPIELLVLSACETAEGDRRATLGLAGIAVRSGARSTIASLWQLQDSVAPLLMEEFYNALFDEGLTKAEALRQAQLSILRRPEFTAPLFWGPVVLVGNWL